MVVPASAWSALTPGAQTLFVYLHTPGKGTWYKTVNISLTSTVGINAATGTQLAFPKDPMVVIARPQEGMKITQKQMNNKFSFNGFALDRNPIVDPKIQLTGPGCSGCNTAQGCLHWASGRGHRQHHRLHRYPTGQGRQLDLRQLSAPPCTSCLYAIILVNNAGIVEPAWQAAGFDHCAPVR